MKKIFNKSGYSLIELIIVIGLIGVLSAPLVLSFTTGLRLYERETTSNESVQSLRSFFINLNEEMRSISIGQATIINNELTIGNTIYKFSNNNIIRGLVGESATSVVLENVDSLTFSDISYIDGEIKSFNISITIEDYEGTFTLDTNYTLRGE